MKNKILILLVLLLLSDVLYQVSFKMVPVNINPIASMLGLYSFTLIMGFTIGFVVDKKLKTKSFKNYYKYPIVILLAFGTFAAEIGHLLIYKFGGDLSKVINLTLPVEAITLLIIGAIIYKEKLNHKNLIGVLFSIVGVLLISM